MDERTRRRLADMVEYSDAAIGFVSGIGVAEFEADARTHLAVIKCVETVGEAAAQIGRPALKRLVPGQPWQDIIGMRNILIHEYFGVSLSTVYETVVSFLPTFANAVREKLESTA